MSESPETLAVLFHPYRLLLDALETLLRDRIAIVAKATTVGEALRLVDAHEPDLLIAGIEADTETDQTLELVRESLVRRPTLKAIAFSSSSDNELLSDAFEAGVTALIASNASPADLSVAIRQATDPSIHFAPRRRRPRSERPAQPKAALTEREIATVRLVARGLSNAEVSRELLVTEQTVKFHLSNIFRKLDVTNRTQASRRAELLDLLGDDADVHASALTH